MAGRRHRGRELQTDCGSTERPGCEKARRLGRSARAREPDAPIVLPLYHVNVVNGNLTLAFRAVTDYGAINDIEVVADP